MVSKVEQARAKAKEAIKKAEAVEAAERTQAEALSEVRKASAARHMAHGRLVSAMRAAADAGASSGDVAKAAGVSRQTVYNWCFYGTDEDVAWRVR